MGFFSAHRATSVAVIFLIFANRRAAKSTSQLVSRAARAREREKHHKKMATRVGARRLLGSLLQTSSPRVRCVRLLRTESRGGGAGGRGGTRSQKFPKKVPGGGGKGKKHGVLREKMFG